MKLNELIICSTINKILQFQVNFEQILNLLIIININMDLMEAIT